MEFLSPFPGYGLSHSMWFNVCVWFYGDKLFLVKSEFKLMIYEWIPRDREMNHLFYGKNHVVRQKLQILVL
jgi:hypothetical protein